MRFSRSVRKEYQIPQELYNTPRLTKTNVPISCESFVPQHTSNTLTRYTISETVRIQRKIQFQHRTRFTHPTTNTQNKHATKKKPNKTNTQDTTHTKTPATMHPRNVARPIASRLCKGRAAGGHRAPVRVPTCGGRWRGAVPGRGRGRTRRACLFVLDAAGAVCVCAPSRDLEPRTVTGGDCAPLRRTHTLRTKERMADCWFSSWFFFLVLLGFRLIWFFFLRILV